jgi:hypothetical protein
MTRTYAVRGMEKAEMLIASIFGNFERMEFGLLGLKDHIRGGIIESDSESPFANPLDAI